MNISYIIKRAASQIARIIAGFTIRDTHSRHPIHLMLKFHSVFVSGVIIIMIFTRRRLQDPAGGGARGDGGEGAAG